MTHSEVQIVQFIKHFLHRHNELCVAGLGRFVCEQQDFIVDPVAKFVYPSSRKINFAQGEFETSPEFILFIEKTCDKPDYVQKLAGLGQSIKAEVIPGKKLEFEGFGSFKLNVLGELDFEPQKRENFDASSFGLSPVHFAANLVKVKRLEITPEQEQEDLETIQMRETALKELKVMLDQAKITESANEKKSSKLFPVLATVLTLILIANLGIFLFKGNLGTTENSFDKTTLLGETGEVIEKSIAGQANKEDTKTNLPVTEVLPYALTHVTIGKVYAKDSFEFDSNAYQTISPVLDSLAVSNNPSTNRVEPTPLVEESVVMEENQQVASEPILESPEMLNADAKENNIVAGFYVVAGAYKNSNNASNLVLSLRRQGFKESIILKPEKYPYHIAAFQRFHTLNGALEQADKLQAKGKKVWIYCAF